MFGRIVTIDGTEVFVSCTPSTPYSEVLRCAANQLEREENEARKTNPIAVMYREHLR